MHILLVLFHHMIMHPIGGIMTAMGYSEQSDRLLHWSATKAYNHVITIEELSEYRDTIDESIAEWEKEPENPDGYQGGYLAALYMVKGTFDEYTRWDQVDKGES